MIKIFCDSCGKEVNNVKETFNINIQCNDGNNNDILNANYKHICRNCIKQIKEMIKDEM